VTHAPGLSHASGLHVLISLGVAATYQAEGMRRAASAASQNGPSLTSNALRHPPRDRAPGGGSLPVIFWLHYDDRESAPHGHATAVESRCRPTRCSGCALYVLGVAKIGNPRDIASAVRSIPRALIVGSRRLGFSPVTSRWLAWPRGKVKPKVLAEQTHVTHIHVTGILRVVKLEGPTSAFTSHRQVADSALAL